MSIQKVIRMGHPLLRQTAQTLTKEEILAESTQKLVQDMLDTMEAEQGIGIAAPQIGVSKQVALVGIPEESSRYPQTESSPLIVVINPVITILDETLQGFWEGCLSVPGLRGFVQRPRKVQIDYLDLNAQPQTIIAEDFLATVFQHELDHLFGKLYVDRITDLSKLSYMEEFVQFWAENPEAYEND